MFRILALIFGFFFVALGLLGFFSSLAPNGMLFGMFHINAMHNIMYIATGLIAFWVGYTSIEGSKFFFQIFGIIYLFCALLGFGYGDKPLFGLIANNAADAWLHLIIALISLYVGFGLRLPKKKS